MGEFPTFRAPDASHQSPASYGRTRSLVPTVIDVSMIIYFVQLNVTSNKIQI